MTLKELNIVNFKNIGEAVLSFCSGFNCFVGNNGVGKTNVLDAIYQLSMCKSFFNLSDTQNIRHGEPFFVLQGKYVRKEEEIDIYCGVKKGQKKIFRKNQKIYDKLSEHIGLLPLVMISPEDIGLIEGGSEGRRRLIDGILSQSDRDYLHRLIRYNRALGQRNMLLKNSADNTPDWEVIEAWDDQLAECGTEIFEKRKKFLEDFKVVFQQYYELISSGKEQVDLEYNSSVKEGDVLETLHASRGRDCLLGYTTAGIHRDDLSMKIEGYPVKKVGSQGQKKTFLIALKLAQYVWLYRINKIKPLLLLDDIFDKLDTQRVRQIIDIVSGDIFGQVFITDTNRTHMDEILRLQHKDYTLFQVENGIFANFAESER